MKSSALAAPRAALALRVGIGALLASIWLSAAPALAVEVYLNGVQITGLASRTFNGCTVDLDAQGNVRITSKDINVTAVNEPPRPASPAGPPTKRYWLVVQASHPGMIQYSVDLFINGKFIKRLDDDDEQHIEELTKYLVLGKNQVQLKAAKDANALGTARRSRAASHILSITIGEGSMAGNRILIDQPLLKYSRNASEVANFDDAQVVVTR